MERFGLFGKLIAKEGERDTLLEILLEAASSMERLTECDLYVVNVSEEDPNAVLVYEVWSNKGAHQASLSLEVTQTLIHRAKPIIAGMERISTLQPMGGKGLSSRG